MSEPRPVDRQARDLPEPLDVDHHQRTHTHVPGASAPPPTFAGMTVPASRAPVHERRFLTRPYGVPWAERWTGLHVDIIPVSRQNRTTLREPSGNTPTRPVDRGAPSSWWWLSDRGDVVLEPAADG